MIQTPAINAELGKKLGAKAGSSVTGTTVLYDLKDIAESILGRKLPVVESIPEDALKTQTLNGGLLWGSSDLLGREVFLPITLETKDKKEYDFPGCVLAIRRAKIVIETPLTERGGEANEIVGFKNWQISMKGFLADPYLQFPEELLLEVADLEKRMEPVRLKCALYDLFSPENDWVMIKDIDLPAQTGIEGVRRFGFSMISNSILTLEVSE